MQIVFFYHLSQLLQNLEPAILNKVVTDINIR